MKDLKPMGVKAPMSLLPRNPLGAIAGVFEHGAIKYGPWNWQDKTQAQARIEELHNALLRHTLASGDPSQDDYDDESGIHHLAHAGACILILLHKLGIDYQASNWVVGSSQPELPANTKIERDPRFRRAARAFWTELLLQEVPETFVLYRCLINGNLSIMDPSAPELTHYVTEHRLICDGYLDPPAPIDHTDTVKNGCYEAPSLINLGGDCGDSETVCHGCPSQNLQTLTPEDVGLDIGPAFEKVRRGMAKGLDMNAADQWDFCHYGPEMAMPFIGNMVHISDEETKRKIIDYFDRVPELLGKIPVADGHFVESQGVYRVIIGRMIWRVQVSEINS